MTALAGAVGAAFVGFLLGMSAGRGHYKLGRSHERKVWEILLEETAGNLERGVGWPSSLNCRQAAALVRLPITTRSRCQP